MGKKYRRLPWPNSSGQVIFTVVITGTRLLLLPLVAATITEFFSQLYADPDTENDPHSAGRQMNAHFASPMVNENGEWLALANQKNLAAGLAPTAGQMPRSLGLAYASKAFREISALQSFTDLSDKGDEVCFCTIGDASTSEGHFWETINAASVLQVPLAIFVWDDGYGISVPKKYQTTKGSISDALRAFRKKKVPMVLKSIK